MSKELKPVKGKQKRQAKRANIKRVAEKYDITKGQARRGLRKMRRADENYISQDYLSSLKMIKNNSSTPFKMKHQSPLNEGVVSSSGGDNTIDYSNMTPEQKSSLSDFWKSEIKGYGGIEQGSEGYNELVGANRYAVYDRGRFKPDGQGGGTYQHDKPQWRLKGGGPEYDNPKGIHPDQLMRMYQGDDNVYE